MNETDSVGQILQAARVARGLSREALALELKLPLGHIEAIENDDWAALPPGRPRPLARQLAERLQVDLEFHTGAFQVVPGGLEMPPPDPRQERMERVVMGTLTAASILVMLWLVVPGPRLGQKRASGDLAGVSKMAPPPPPLPSESPYPVLGELLPEAPLNPQGILVSLRALDVCEVKIEPAPEAGSPVQDRTLRVSEPWRLRVKGPFVITLQNAGVVNLEVAGQRIPHNQNIGETWTGRFDAEGHWLRPAPPVPGVEAETAPPDPQDDVQDKEETRP
ncbi:MAG TPA: helix-turn-helix domain-containing protein [Geothrix sp.]|nr:helix-turn-helix domain-containing protein [Geothrix sp.]